MNPEEQKRRIEDLAEGIVNSASQYQVIRELGFIGNPRDDDERIYVNFLMAMLAAFEDTSGYEH